MKQISLEFVGRWRENLSLRDREDLGFALLFRILLLFTLFLLFLRLSLFKLVSSSIVFALSLIKKLSYAFLLHRWRAFPIINSRLLRIVLVLQLHNQLLFIVEDSFISDVVCDIGFLVNIGDQTWETIFACHCLFDFNVQNRILILKPSHTTLFKLNFLDSLGPSLQLKFCLKQFLKVHLFPQKDNNLNSELNEVCKYPKADQDD